jgi:hypothetical protein
MTAGAAFTPRSETAPASSVAQPGRMQPTAAPETAALAPLDRGRQDALGATLARAVQLRAQRPPVSTLQRMYFPDDEELEDEPGPIGQLWNWISSLFWSPATETDTEASDDEMAEDLDDVLEEVPEATEKDSAERALVVVGSASHQPPQYDLAAAVRAIAIRQDFEVNQRLLESLQRRTAFQYVHTYSPDIERAVVSTLEAVGRRLAAEREAKALERAAIEQRNALERAESERLVALERAERERLQALEREAIRVLDACQRIHAELRKEFKRTMLTRDMRMLASHLATFVIEADLGSELTSIASSISTGVNRLEFKEFKVSEAVVRDITEARSLLVALTRLREAVGQRLTAQEQAKQPRTHKPTKHELETKARFERRKLRESTRVEELAEIVPQATQETVTTVVSVPAYVPKIFDPGWNEMEMRTWIDAATKRAIAEKNIKDCVAHVKAHTPTTGGGTSFKHEGRTVFHISHGKKGSRTGCTLFFTKEGDRVQIVAIGQHAGPASYALDWKVPTFSGNVNEYTVAL